MKYLRIDDQYLLCLSKLFVYSQSLLQMKKSFLLASMMSFGVFLFVMTLFKFPFQAILEVSHDER